MGLLPDRVLDLGLLPAGRAREGTPEELIHETGHRHTPIPGLVVEAGHKKPVDHGRVVAILGHILRF